MIGSLALTGLLAIVWTDLARLTGFGSEETMFLQATGVTIPMRGLLLAGMILGTAGVLDDVVLAQTITVFELANADPTQRPRVLYTRGMRVGVAHLASMINTLVLAYASTALPLLILFYLYPEPWYLTINRECGLDAGRAAHYSNRSMGRIPHPRRHGSITSHPQSQHSVYPPRAAIASWTASST